MRRKRKNQNPTRPWPRSQQRFWTSSSARARFSRGARCGGSAVQESDYRAGPRRRAHPPSGVSARRDQAGGHHQSAQWDRQQDRADRRRAARYRRAARSRGTFEPQLIPKHERRFTGFDDKILALYARGMTVREIQAFLAEMYAVEVSPDLISTVTDGIVAEVTAWQSRPLERMYPSCSSMPCGSRFATKRWCAAKPSTSRSRSSRTAAATSSGSGSSRPRARSSG